MFIVAENDLTVTGPALDRTVKSLAIGGDETASATLNLVSGVTLTTTNGTTNPANGTISGTGTIGGPVTVNAGGILMPGNSPGTITGGAEMTARRHSQSGTGLTGHCFQRRKRRHVECGCVDPQRNSKLDLNNNDLVVRVQLPPKTRSTPRFKRKSLPLKMAPMPTLSSSGMDRA